MHGPELRPSAINRVQGLGLGVSGLVFGNEGVEKVSPNRRKKNQGGAGPSPARPARRRCGRACATRGARPTLDMTVVNRKLKPPEHVHDPIISPHVDGDPQRSFWDFSGEGRGPSLARPAPRRCGRACATRGRCAGSAEAAPSTAAPVLSVEC